MSQEYGLPKKVFFSCTPEEFLVVDVEAAGQTLMKGEIQPWMAFENGPGNLIDSKPKKVVHRQGNDVGVECDEGTVYIDFFNGTARKESDSGNFIYKGTIDQRNGSLGYMPIS